MNKRPVVTLTTDFGQQDHYVGTMKGVVLNICPEAILVDICHEVPSFDIVSGALTIAAVYKYFPAGTVHVLVVDPGVGGARRPIIAEASGHTFVCPDNGLLSLVLDQERDVAVRHATNDRYFLHPVSNTFHGRDIFSPVAAHIAAGVPVDSLGPLIRDYVKLAIAAPTVESGKIAGCVLKIDRFGNVVTNITLNVLADGFGAGTSFVVRIAGSDISDIRPSYAGAPQGQLFVIFGSMGRLEISANRSSAAALLGIKPGTVVEVRKT